MEFDNTNPHDVFGRNLEVWNVIAIIDHRFIQSIALIIRIKDKEIIVRYFDYAYNLLETEYSIGDTFLNCIILQTPDACLDTSNKLRDIV